MLTGQNKGPGAHGDRVASLDLLRGFAVLAVILFHYTFRGAAADNFTSISIPEFTDLAKYGYFGVQLFFVISGFVIAFSADGRSATEFAIARLARIYPGFVFCMTVTFIITLACGAPRFDATGSQWFANLFIVAPALKQPFMDGAYWSIVYEITFYGWVMLLLMVGLFRRRRIDPILLIWLALSLLNETVLNSSMLRRILITDYSGFFAAGIIIYEIYGGRRDANVMTLLMLATVIAVRQSLIGAQHPRDHYGVAIDELVIIGLSVLAIAAVGLAACLRRVPLPAGLVLALGGLTYSLYLLHQHIGYIAFNRLKQLASAPVIIVVTTGVMIGLSWLVWRFVERPGQRLIKRLLTRWSARLGLPMKPPALPATEPLHAEVRQRTGSPGRSVAQPG